MKRTEVYRLIDEEREYQDTIRRQNEHETRNDDEKSVSEFLLYIEHMLERAKKSIYELNTTAAMDNVRKIAALSVAAMEAFDTPGRVAQRDITGNPDNE